MRGDKAGGSVASRAALTQRVNHIRLNGTHQHVCQMLQTLTSAPTRCWRCTAVPSCRHAATLGRAVSGSWIYIQAVFRVTESGNTLQLAPCVAVSLKIMSTRVLNRPLGCKSNLSGVVFNWRPQSEQLGLSCQIFSCFFFFTRGRRRIVWLMLAGL